MFARLFTLIPKSITQNSDLKVVKNLACDVSAQVPKLMGWSVPLGLLGGWMVFPALTPEFKRAITGGGFIEPSNIQYEEEEIGSVPVEK